MNGLISPSCLLKGALGSEDRGILLAEIFELSFAEKLLGFRKFWHKIQTPIYLKTTLAGDRGKLGGCQRGIPFPLLRMEDETEEMLASRPFTAPSAKHTRLCIPHFILGIHSLKWS